MTRIPENVRRQLQEEPEVCARSNKDCRGRITWEHAFTYRNRKIQERWAIIKLCERHHSVLNYQNNGLLDKDINKKLAAKRATKEERLKYPKLEWRRYG